ncbi:hypothetical protein TRFO_18314 [Tritrichomonas foetus]|uniref:PAS domain-containing protein n=1 Tax=Tritrichomonas foetus TaxID=1144522 RepID=A0A1J4KRC8_9EUKA|nr:hypothetical protein TRFO_18314 [Tritrichomonas foetus]|eukprot:OHT12021.1 hypothetical protein TRFO_18314 [Tritrichomonas foetus]
MNSAKFPNSFFFFGKISQYKSPVSILGQVLNLYSYIQLATLSLIPVVIKRNIDGTHLELCKTIYGILSLYHHREAIFSEPFYTIIFLLLTLLVVSSVLVLYKLTQDQVPIPKSLLKLRGFLFLYHPTIYLMAVSFATSSQLQYFTENLDMNAVNIFNFICGLIIILILIIFQYWITPLFYTTPFNEHHGILFASEIIPSNTILYQKDIIIIVSVIFSAFVFNTMTYSFCCIIFVLGIKNLLYVIKHPYTSIFFTSCEIGVFFTLAFGTVILTVLIQFNEKDIFLWIPSVVSFVVGFFGGYIYITKKEAYILTKIKLNQWDDLENDNFFYLTNAVITHKHVCERYQQIVTAYIEKSSFDIKYQLIDILCGFVLCKQTYEKINILNSISNLPRAEIYILFTFTRYQSSRLNSKPPELYELNRLTNQFIILFDTFWNFRMEGDIEKCLVTTRKIRKITRDLKIIFYKCKLFHPNCQEVMEFESNFMWRLYHNDETNVTTNELLSERVHHLLPKAKSVLIYIILILALFLATCCLTNMNNFEFLKDNKSRLLVTTNVNYTLKVGSNMVKVLLGVHNLVNCTENSNITVDHFFELIQSEKEPKSVELVLVHDYIQQFYNLTNELTSCFRESSNDDFTIWNVPCINFSDTVLPIIHFGFYYILNSWQLYDGIMTCDCELIDFYRNVSFIFTSQVQQLLTYFIDILDTSQEPIEAFQYNNRYYYLGIFTLVLLLCFSLMFKIIQHYRCFTIVKENFRTKFHPNNMEYLCGKQESKYALQPRCWEDLLVTIMFFVIFFAQYFIMSYYINYYKSQIIDSSEMLIKTEQVALMSSSALIDLLSSWSFYDGNVTNNNWNNFYSSSLEFSQMISLIMKNYPNKNVKEIIQDIIDESIKMYSIHDIYSQWSTTKLISLLFFYLSSISEVDINSHSFIEIQHILITHLIPYYHKLTEEFSEMVLFSDKMLNNIIIYEIIIIVVVFLVYAFYISYSSIKYGTIIEQINNMISFLAPNYIGSNKCLMNYLIGDQQTFSDSDEKYSFLRFLNEIDVPLIVTSSKFSIIGFTRAIKIMFNYREEQLIGQLLSLLIPKNEKSYRFYNNVKNGESTMTLFVNGVTSSNEIILLEVSVTKLRIDSNIYYMMEMKSLYDIEYYEDYCQAHKDLFDDIIINEIPIFATKDTKNINFVLCYCSYEDEQNSFVVSDVSNFKSGLEQCLEKYQKAIFLYNSCSTALALFVCDDSDYIENAINFVSEFGHGQSDKIGILINGRDLCTFLFPVPEIENEADIGGITVEKASEFTPRPLVEGTAIELAYLPSIIYAAERGTLIVSEPFLNYLGDADATKMKDIIPGSTLYSLPLPQ